MASFVVFHIYPEETKLNYEHCLFSLYDEHPLKYNLVIYGYTKVIPIKITRVIFQQFFYICVFTYMLSLSLYLFFYFVTEVLLCHFHLRIDDELILEH